MCAIFGIVSFVILIFMTIDYILGWGVVPAIMETVSKLLGG